MTDAAAWLSDLAVRLPRHAEVLGRLVEGVQRDERVVQLSVGCSIGRGSGDDLSDLDCELSLEPAAWPAALDLVEPLVRSLGPVISLIHHRWDGCGTAEHRRTAVIYATAPQLDLMVWPVTVWSGMHPPGSVVLHGTRAVWTRPWDPARGLPTPERLQEWWFLGWWALLDADKYLRRGSLWEARQRLEEARTAVWRLTAAAQGLPFAEFGITALLDGPDPRLPPGMEATAADLDASRLRSAVVRCAQVLDEQSWGAASLAGADRPAATALARWASRRLILPDLAAASRPEHHSHGGALRDDGDPRQHVTID